METPKIGELVARYDFPNGDYITLRSKDGKVRITSASMNTETGKEVTDAIADFKSRIAERKEEPTPAPKPKKATKSVGKDGRRIWTAEERADIISLPGRREPQGDRRQPRREQDVHPTDYPPCGSD